MKLSIIIPFYNEIKTIGAIIDRITALKDIDKEIIIVDDFSKDGTREFLKKLSTPGIKVYFHEKNVGKGGAIRTGLKNMTGDAVIIQDADLEYDPAEYGLLLKPIFEGKTKVVYGSRFLGNRNEGPYITHYMATLLLNLMVRVLYGAKITDEATCYKLFTKDVIESVNLKCERFEFCPEVTAKVLKKGYKILEVPISYSGRTFDEGKKINWRDGVEAIWTLIKYRFTD